MVLLVAMFTLLMPLQPVLAAGAGGEAEQTDSTLGGALSADRAEVARQLVSLGYEPAEADVAATELTDEDIAVLLGHPKMMQSAGETPNLTAAFIVGAVIVAGVIILAANGSGSISIN
jgi:hypothetical protein